MSDSQYISHTPRFELLTRENYDTWRIQVEALLVKNDVWDYVSGTNPPPNLGGADAATRTAAETAYKTWSAKDRKAKSDLTSASHRQNLRKLKIASHLIKFGKN